MQRFGHEEPKRSYDFNKILYHLNFRNLTSESCGYCPTTTTSTTTTTTFTTTTLLETKSIAVSSTELPLNPPLRERLRNDL